MLSAPALISSFHGAMSAVMSLTRPASTCWRRPPPPHVWNRSGTSPCWSSVVSLVLNASFSLTWMSIVTLGWAAVYSAARSFQRLSPGSLFWMWYQVMVTGSPPAAADSLAAVVGAAVAAVDGALVAAPLEHAPTTSIAVAASAAIRPRDIDMCPRSSCSESCEIVTACFGSGTLCMLDFGRQPRIESFVRLSHKLVETFDGRGYTRAMTARSEAAPGRNGTTIAVIAREAGVYAPTV